MDSPDYSTDMDEIDDTNERLEDCRIADKEHFENVCVIYRKAWTLHLNDWAVTVPQNVQVSSHLLNLSFVGRNKSKCRQTTGCVSFANACLDLGIFIVRP
ncbi:hypothetical protein ACI65C_009131 [Semiaphis heraclei]